LEELKQTETGNSITLYLHPPESQDQTLDCMGQMLATSGTAGRHLDSWWMSTGRPYMEQKQSQQLQRKEQCQLLPGSRGKHRSELNFARFFLRDSNPKAIQKSFIL